MSQDVKKSYDELVSVLKNFDDNCWYNISRQENLSEDFIREFQDLLDWREISYSQKLSEDFIREFEEKVSWYAVSCSQKLSEDFIREFAEKVDWKDISYHQTLSESFINEFSEKLDLEIIKKNKARLAEEEKKEEVKAANVQFSVVSRIRLLFD